MIKKADIGLLCALIIIGIFASFFFGGAGDSGKYAEVTVGSEYYGTYDLSKDREVLIDSHDQKNLLRIEDGEIFMVEADCPNQDCIAQGAVSHAKQNIVCLPNKVFVSISGADEIYEIDAVAH